MVRVGLTLAAIGIAGYYLFTIEQQHVNNSLVCQYGGGNFNILLSDVVSKITARLTNQYPQERLKVLTQTFLKSGLPILESSTCDQKMNEEFRTSPFFENRMALFPLYPSSGRSLVSILKSQKQTRALIFKLKNFKEEINKESDQFKTFLQDCAQMKTFVDQIHLLKSHLKVEKRTREPSGRSKKGVPSQTIETHMNMNISKQLEFAQRQLGQNEKLFQYKWNVYFQYPTGNQLCQY